MFQIIAWIRGLVFFRKYPTLRQMVKFALVGGVNTVIDFSVYFSLTRLFSFWQDHYLWANFISFSLAVTFSFFANRRWTFRIIHRGLHLQYLKFFTICAIGLMFTELILFTLVDLVKIYDILAKMIAVIIVYFWNFNANRYWTFRRQGFF